MDDLATSKHLITFEPQKLKNMSFKPLGKRVLIEKIKEEQQKEGSIIIPDTIAIIFSKGIVAYKSEEVKTVEVGDTVLFPANAGNVIKQDGKEMILMNVEALEAII